MNDTLNPSQLTTLCLVFFAFHLVALPAFYWAMRHRQFSGAEQCVWAMDDPHDAPTHLPVDMGTAVKTRWMLAVLLTMATLMLSSIVLTMFVALHAPAHPVTTAGKCPF